jgi:Skp family chaperone for outer membrane proteins
MKKSILAIAIVMIAAAASAEVKIASVDMMALIKNHPNYASNKELLTATDKDYQKKLEAIKAEAETLQQEGKKLADQIRNPMMAAKAKADIEKRLGDIQQKLFGIQQRYQSEAMRCRQDLQDLEGRLLKTTTDDIRRRLAKFAEKKGLDFILDQTAAPFFKKDADVTKDVLTSMGVDPSQVKGENNESK